MQSREAGFPRVSPGRAAVSVYHGGGAGMMQGDLLACAPMPALYTIEDIDAWFDATAVAGGVDCFNRGLVVGVELAEETDSYFILAGVVAGSGRRRYEVTVDWDGEAFEGYCGCRDSYDCKHAVAVLFAYLAQQHGPSRAPAAASRPQLGFDLGLPALPQAPSLPPPQWREVLAAAQGPRFAPADNRLSPLTIQLRAATPPAGPPAAPRLELALVVGTTRVPPGEVGRVVGGAHAGVKPLLQALLAYLPAVQADGWFAIAPAEVDAVLGLLSGSSRLRDEAGQPLELRPWDPLTLRLAYHRDGEAAELRPIPADAPDDAQAPLVLGAPRGWAWVGQVLRPLAAGPLAGLAQAGPVRVSAPERPDLERRLPDLVLGGHVCGPELPAAPKVKKGKPTGQLVLEEADGRLVGRLGYLYGGVRVEADDELAHAGPPQGPYLARNQTQERRLAALLPQPAPPRKSRNRWDQLYATKPVPAARFELEGEAALDFLIDDLPGLIAKGLEVLGEDQLARLRVSRGGARTSFHVHTGIDWLGVEGHLTIEDEDVPWPALWEALTASRRYVRLGSGRMARLPADWLRAQRPLLEALGGAGERLGAKDGVRVARWQAPAIDALLASADEAKTDASWRAFAERLRSFGGIEPVPVPAGFTGELRPYQHQGLSFLAFLRDYGLHGILADDMGLGKTVQAAALLLANHDRALAPDEPPAPSLVVAPTSLLHNWHAELARFAPALRTVVLHGPGRDLGAIATADVVITTYATACA